MLALDLRFSAFPQAHFARVLKSFQPDLVGLTAFSHEAQQACQLASLTKKLQPKAKVVVGGHHATACPESVRVPGVDWVVRGEGCRPFAELGEALSRGEEPQPHAELVPTGPQFATWVTAPPPAFASARELPRPRHDLWDMRRYRIVWTHDRAQPFAPLWRSVAMVRTSFGCRMHCTFCPVLVLFGGKHWPRDPEDVAEEIAQLPVGHVYFSDDENLLDREFSLRLAEALRQRGVKKRSFAWVR